MPIIGTEIGDGHFGSFYWD